MQSRRFRPPLVCRDVWIGNRERDECDDDCAPANALKLSSDRAPFSLSDSRRRRRASRALSLRKGYRRSDRLRLPCPCMLSKGAYWATKGIGACIRQTLWREGTNITHEACLHALYSSRSERIACTNESYWASIFMIVGIASIKGMQYTRSTRTNNSFRERCKTQSWRQFASYKIECHDWASRRRGARRGGDHVLKSIIKSQHTHSCSCRRWTGQ